MSIADKLQTIAENEQKVYEAGKQAEWSEFWDNLQDYGNRTNYTNVFNSKYWNDNIFKPKYNIQFETAQFVFKESNVTDLAQILKDCNVTLDFSQVTSMNECFTSSQITHIPILDLRHLPTINMGVYSANRVRTIDKVILSDNGSQTFVSTLIAGAIRLENITFEGTIGNSIILKDAPFTVESLLNIIEHLQDLNAVGKTTCTLTIGSTNLAKLTDEEKAIATQKGWTLA